VVYIDALMGVLGGKVNTGSDSAVREQLARLHAAVSGIGAQVFATRHLNKGEKSLAEYAGGGSIAFTAFARSVLVCTKDPDAWDDRSRGILAHTKGNIGPEGRSIRYRIVEAETDVTRVEWIESCDWTAQELITWKPEREQTEETRARLRFLIGWWGEREAASAAETKAAAKALGLEFGKPTWQSACSYFGIKPSGRGRNAIWIRHGDTAATPLDAEDPLGKVH